jgi:hypothetical protein
MAWGFGSHTSGRPKTSDEITWPTLISDYVDQQQSARLCHWPLPSQSQSAQGSPSSSGGIMVFNNSIHHGCCIGIMLALGAASDQLREFLSATTVQVQRFVLIRPQ